MNSSSVSKKQRIGMSSSPSACRSSIGAGFSAKGLVVTHNPAAASLISDALQRGSIAADISTSFEDTRTRVLRDHYDVVVVDLRFASKEQDLITYLRSSSSSRTSIILAIADCDRTGQQAFSSGAHFLVYAPLARSKLDAVLNAAYGLIVRERRRYFRCPVELPVVAQHGTHAAWQGHSLNLSEGGMCLVAPVRLSCGERLQIQFRIPSTSIEISATATVQWISQHGRVGVRFVSMQSESVSDLQHWLAVQFESSAAN